MVNISVVLKKVLVFSFILLIAGAVEANPIGGVITNGSATISSSGNTLTVNQSSQQAIVNWNSFNIAAGETTHFQQPVNGVALNRINPNQGASQIYGSLTATGRIILINGAGIHFGPGSMVNVGGLIASTSDISNRNFLNGKYKFNKASKFAGSIINEGTIKTADYGLVALLGTGVVNSGVIRANLGSIVLGAGSKFTLDFNGDQLVNFAVTKATNKAGVDVNGNKLASGVANSGALLANGGQILVTANVAAGVLDNVIDMSGVAQARSVGKRNGEIILSGGTGKVSVSGKLNASGRGKKSKGGLIEVLGTQIYLSSTADLIATGGAGGGNIYIGGNEHGTGPLQDALTTTVAAGATLNASATYSGNGGNIIVWSNDETTFEGIILAQGGLVAGNGGFSEVSGHELLNFDGGSVNLTAVHGAMGTLLLDPENVTIQTAGSTTGSFDGANPDNFTPNQDNSILTVTDLQNLLATTNVNVTTGTSGSQAGDITVANALTWSSSNTLTLTAANNIYLNASITATNGGLTLNAAGGNNSGVGLITSGTEASPVAAGVNVAINVGTFDLQQGMWNQIAPTLPTFSATNFILSYGNNNTQFMRATNSSLTNLGASSNPYQITDVYGLEGIGSNGNTLNDDYVLANNINASGTANWNDGNGNGGFVPIGLTTFSGGGANQFFTGVFNGQNHIINGLTITSTNNGNNSVGLFSAFEGTIENLGLTNTDITANGAFTAGAIVGDSNGSAILSNVYSSGLINNNNGAGGLIGTIQENSATTITNSFSAETVNSVYESGGLVGSMEGGSIAESYFIGSAITTGSYAIAGGLVGENYEGSGFTITNSYNLGSVTNQSGTGTYAGGIVGEMTNSGTVISYVYNAGAVSGGTTGGLIGKIANGASLKNSYWDTTTSGQSNAVGSGSAGANVAGGCLSGTCTNGGTVNLSQQSTYSGWNFSTIWQAPTSTHYPYLDGQTTLLSGQVSGGAAGETITLYGNGTTLGSATLDASGVYSITDTSIVASNTDILAVLSGGNISNTVAVSTNAFLDSGINLTANAVTVGTSNTATISLAQMQTAATGVTANSNLLYSVSTVGGSLTLTLGANSGAGTTINLVTTQNTTFDAASIQYVANNNATGNFTFNGPVQVNGDGVFDTRGNIVFNSTLNDVTSNTDTLQIHSPSVTFNANVGALDPFSSLDITDATGGRTGTITIDAPNSTMVIAANSLTIESTINDAVAGQDDLDLEANINSASSLELDGNIGTGTKINNLSLTTTATPGNDQFLIGSAIIDTVGNQTYSTGADFFGIGGSTTLNASGSTSNIGFTNVEFDAGTTSVTAGNKVTYNGTTDGATNLTSTGTISGNQVSGNVGATTPLASLTLDGSSVVNGVSITTSGAQTYNGLSINGNATLTSTSGTITFDSAVEDANGGNDNLIVQAATTDLKANVGDTSAFSAVTFSGVTPGSTGNVVISGNLGVNTNNNITFNSGIDGTTSGSDSLTLNSSQVTFGGNIGSSTHLGNLIIDNNFNGNSGAITIDNSISITANTINFNTSTNSSSTANNLTLAAATIDLFSDVGGFNNITITDAAGGDTASVFTGTDNIIAVPAGMTIEANGTLSIGGTINDISTRSNDLFELNLQAANIDLYANIGTGGSEPYYSVYIADASGGATGAAVLENNITIKAATYVALASSVNSPSTMDPVSLTLQSPSNLIEGGAVGGIHPLETLTATDEQALNNGSGLDSFVANITTVGNQYYYNPIENNEGLPTFTSNTGTILFNQAFEGNFNQIKVSTSLGVTFNGFNGITLDVTSGLSTLNGDTFTAQNPITFQALELTANQVITSTSGSTGGINLDSTVDGAYSLTLQSRANDLTGVVGGTTPLLSLTLADQNGNGTGTDTISSSSITTQGAQLYKKAVNLSGSTLLFNATGANGNTSSITFNSTVNGVSTGVSSLSLESQANTLSGNVGLSHSLASLSLSDSTGSTTGADVLGAITVSTQANQNYSNTLTINSGATLESTSGAINLKNSVAGSNNLVLNAQSVVLSGNVGSSGTPFANITIADASGGTTGTAALASGVTSVSIYASTALTLDSAFTLASTNSLTLSSAGALAINNTIEGTGNTSVGSLTLGGGNTSQSITDASAINVNNFTLAQGEWYQVNSSLPTFTVANDFSIAAGSAFNSEFNAEFTRATAQTGGTNFTIADIYGLQGIATMPLSNSYTLANNITAPSSISDWTGPNSNTGFTPIGNSTSSFTGTFNGEVSSSDGTITGLYISNSNSNVGMFSYVSGSGSIENLGLVNVNVTGGSNVGALVGQTSGTTFNISNDYSTGSVTATAVTASTGAGGLIGYLTANATDDYSSAVVTSMEDAGGLIGDVVGGVVNTSYATGSVTNNGTSGSAGGLIGAIASGSVTNTYSSGNVVSGGNAGGFIGANAGTIATSYSIGSVSASGTHGGFAGTNTGTITDGYFNETTTGTTTGVGSGSGTGVTALTTAQMQQFNNYAGFDFTSGSPTWAIPQAGGYPVLTALTPGPYKVLGAVISGQVVGGNDDSINFYFDGTYIGMVTTDSSGVYSFVTSGLSGSGDILAYLTAGGMGSSVTSIPNAYATISGFNFNLNTLNVGDAGTKALGIGDLSTAAGALSSSLTLYSIASNVLTLNSGIGMQTTAATTLNITGNINATANLQFNGPVTVANNPVINSTGNIVFGSSIDDVTAGADNLTLQSPSITLDGNVGSTAQLNNVTISDASGGNTGNVIIGGNVNVGATSSITIDSTIDGTTSGIDALTLMSQANTLMSNVGVTVNLAGLTLEDSSGTGTGTGDFIGGTIIHANSQTYQNPLNLTAGSTAFTSASSSGGITFGNLLDGGSAVTITTSTAGSGVTFNGSLGSNNSLSSLDIEGGAAIFGNNASEVQTTGDQIYNGTSLTLNSSFSFNYGGSSSSISGNMNANNNSLSFNGGSLTLNNTDSDNDLNVSLGSGTLVINNSNALGSDPGINIYSGATLVIDKNFTISSGTQSSISNNGTIVLNANLNLDSVTVSQNNLIQTSGTYSITGAADLDQGNFEVDGSGNLTVDISVFTINKSGTGTLTLGNGAFQMGSNTITAGTLELTDTTNVSGSSFTVNSGALLQFDGNVSGVTLNLSGTGISNSGPVTFPEIDSSTINLNTDVAINGGVTLGNGSGTDNTVNDVNGAHTLTFSGDVTLNANINSDLTPALVFQSPVSVGSDSTITAKTITFGSTVDDANIDNDSLALQADTINLNGSIGGSGQFENLSFADTANDGSPGAININTDTILSSNNLTIGSSIDDATSGAHALTLEGFSIGLNANIGGTKALKSITILDGSGGNTSAIAVGNTISLSAANSISVGGTLDDNNSPDHDITLASQLVTLYGNVGSLGSFNNITIADASGTGTTGTLSVGSSINLTANNSITIYSKIDDASTGSDTLQLFSQANTLKSDVGDTSELDALLLGGVNGSGNDIVSASSIHTVDNQDYQNNTTFNTPSTLSLTSDNGDISFGALSNVQGNISTDTLFNSTTTNVTASQNVNYYSEVDGETILTSNAGSGNTGNDGNQIYLSVGSVTPLTSLHFEGGGQDNIFNGSSGSITIKTSGDQTYDSVINSQEAVFGSLPSQDTIIFDAANVHFNNTAGFDPHVDDYNNQDITLNISGTTSNITNAGSQGTELVWAQNSGTLTLNSTISFEDTTYNVNSGATVIVGNANSLSQGTLDVNSGGLAKVSTNISDATINLNGDGSGTAIQFLVSGTVDIDSSSFINVANNPGINTSNAGDVLTIDAQVNQVSNDTFAINGPGTVVLTNSGNTFSGVTVNSGTLSVTQAGALGSAAASVNSGATFNLNNTTLSDATVTLNGGTLTATGTSGFGNFSQVDLSANSFITSSGTLSFDSTSFIQANGGTNASLTINSPNSGFALPYIDLTNGGSGSLSVTTSGDITQNDVLLVSGSSTFNAGAGAITLNDTNQSSINTAVTGNNFSGVVNVSNTGANAINVINNADLTVGTVSSGQDINFTTTTGNLTVGSAITLTSNNTLSLTSAGNIVINNSIEGAGNTSAGSLVLSAQNAAQSITATGAINVSDFTLSQGQWYQNSSTLPEFIVGDDFSLVSGSQYNNAFSGMFTRVTGGDGVTTPYTIADIYGLQGAATMDLSSNYVLATNLDASATSNWNSGTGFAAIGNDTSSYTGTFNGEPASTIFTITNLSIAQPTAGSSVGLFGNIGSAGVVENLGLITPTVTGQNAVGALVGTNNGSVTGSYVSGGSVSGNSKVGGLVGENEGSITNSYNNGAAVSGVANVGGLVGEMDSGTISLSYSTGNVTGNASSMGEIGGFIGTEARGSIDQSYSTGNVSILAGGDGAEGGFVGNLGSSFTTGSITNSYSTGNVTAGSLEDQLGGFVGSVAHNSTITTSYSAGVITAPSNVVSLGGFSGGDDGTGIYTNDFFDSTKAGTTTAIGYGSSSTGVTGMTTAEMQGSFRNYTGFDFTSNSPIWAFTTDTSVNGGYPVLTALTPGPYQPALNGISISGDVVGGSGDTVSFYLNGVYLGFTSVGSNNEYTFLSNGVATSGGDILAYLTGNGVGSVVTLAASENVTITGLNLQLNAVGVGDAGVNALSNADLITATSGISSSLSLFTAGSGNAITLAAGVNFFTSQNTTYTINGAIATSGNVTFGGSVVAGSNASVTTTSGAISTQAIDGANDLALSSTAGTTIAGDVGSQTALDDITIAGGGSITGVVSGSGTSITVDGGTLDISNSNTYDGGTTVNSGDVVLTNGSGLGAGAVTVVSGGELDVSGGVTVANAVTLNGSGVAGAGALHDVSSADTDIFSGAIALGSAATINAGSASTLEFTNSVGGANDLTLTGTGTINLQAAVNVNSVTAPVSHLGISTNITTAGSQSYTGAVTLGSSSILSSTGAGSISLAAVSGNGNSLEISTDGSSAITGIYSNGSLTKAGNGTLTLSNANTYSGGTTISAGVVNLTNAAGAGTGSVNIESTGELELTTTANTSFANAMTDSGLLVDASSGVMNTLSNLSLGANAAVTVTNANETLNVSNALTGANALTKSGAGILVLSGANTYSGATNVNAGILEAGAADAFSSSSVISLANVAGVQLNLNGNSQTIAGLTGAGTTGGNVVLGAGTLTVVASAANVYSGVISGTGGLIVSGAGSLELGQGVLYSGTTTINGSLQIDVANGLQSSTAVAVNAGGTLNLNGENQLISQLQGAGSVTGLTTGTTLTNAQGNTTTTFSGTITGAGNLTIGNSSSDTGTFILSGANTGYTGTTTVASGVLQVINNSALGTGALGINAGAEIDLNTTVATTFANAITNSGTIADVSSGLTNTLSNLILGANGIVDVTNAGKTLSVSNALTGTNGFTKSGAGTLSLSGANTYSGVTNINAGTLSVGAGSLSAASSVNFANVANAQLNLNGNNESVSGLTGGGTTGGNVILGAGTLTISTVAANVYAGAISGNGGLIISGTGSEELTQSVRYTGSTAVNSGTLQVDTSNALSTSSSVTVGGTLNLGSQNQLISNFSGTGSVTGFSSGNTLTVADGSTGGVFSGTISGAGNLTVGNSAGDNGTFILSGANTGYTGTTTVAFGVLQVTNSSALGTGAVTVNSELELNTTSAGTFANAITNSGSLVDASSGLTNSLSNLILGTSSTLTVTNANETLNVTNALTGSNGFTKTGAGTLILSGANTYSGVTTVNGGALQAGAVNALSASSNINLANAAGVELNLNGNNQSVLALTGGGATGGNVVLGAGTLTFNNTAADSFAGVISGTGGVTLSGSSTVTLSGANTYSGATTVNSGELAAGADDVISTSSAVVLNDSATFALNSFNQDIGSLAGSADSIVNLGAAELTTGNDNTDTTYAGTINGTGGVTKVGSGNFTLAGSNTYSGVTDISQGTLTLTNANAIANSTLQIDSTGTLGLGIDTTLTALTGNGDVNVASGITLTVDNGTSDAFDGILSGAGSFEKIGAGTLTLNGVNTFTGSIAVNEGSLQMGVANAINNASDITIGSSGTLDLNNFNTSISSIAGTGLLNIGSATLTLGDSNATSFGGSITGSGTLAIVSSGSLTLTSDSVGFTGTTNVSGGNLILASAAALGTSSVNISSGTLSISGVNIANAINLNGGTLNGTGNSSVSSNIAVSANSTISTSSTADDFVLAGNIDGAASIVIQGAGKVVLAEAVGGSTPLASVSSASGSTTQINSSVTTSGNQNYNGAVVLGGDTTLTATGNSTVALNAGVSGNYDLAITGNSQNLTAILSGSLAVNNITVTGSGSNNSLTVNSGEVQTWNLSGTNAGSITGITEENGNFNFSNIQNIMGSQNGDIFQLNGGNINSITGGGGSSTLVINNNVANTFNITAMNAGNVTGVNAFANIQNLTGGSLTNDFVFADGAGVAGAVTGAGSSANTLDYSAYASPITAIITAQSAGTSENSGNAVIGSFSNVQNLISNGNSVLVLSTMTNNLVTFTGAAAGFINDPLNFSGFSSVVGGNTGSTVVSFAPGVTAVFTSPNTANVNGSPTTFSNVQSFNGNYVPFTASSEPDSEFVNNADNGIDVASIINSTVVNNNSGSSNSDDDGSPFSVTTTSYVENYVGSNLNDIFSSQQNTDVIILKKQKFFPNCSG